MKSKVKQMLSVILTVCMLATVVPLNAYAADVDFGDSETTDLTVDSDEAADVDISEEESTDETDISVDEADSQDENVEDAESQDEDLFTSEESADEFSAEAEENIADCYALTNVPAPQLTESFFKIVFVDCGRKYFSVSSLEKIIDNAAEAGFNYVELGVGNDGLRFLLDDMSLTVNGKTYESDAVKAAIHQGNEAYHDFDTDELTQTEMDTVIKYASDKGMGIIPMINTPGHMDAILSAATSLTGKTCSYNRSARTIDVTNATAVAFTQALVQKYINYFAGKNCKLFNMGADEYANDKYTSGSMGFGNLQSTGKYSYYVQYVNTMASMIKKSGMTPMAFNDGIYFNSNTSSGTFDTDIVICYWSNGWTDYTPMSAADLKSKGFNLINTHGSYYWVLGKNDWQCDATKASGFNYKEFQGGTIDDPLGAMFCIWCDYPGAGTEDSVIASTANTIKAFGETLPKSTVATETPTPPSNDIITGEKKEKTINLVVGETKTDTQEGVDVASFDKNGLDETIATVSAEYKQIAGTTTIEKVSNITSGESYYISDGNGNYLTLNGSGLTNVTDIANATKWTVTSANNGYIISSGNYYLRNNNNSLKTTSKYNNATRWSYSSNGVYNNGYLNYNNGWELNRNSGNSGVYTTKTTPATKGTEITFTGVSVGTTQVQIGDVYYTINVLDKAPDTAITAENIDLEYWITNVKVYDASSESTGKTSKTISSTEAASDEGIAIADIAQNPAYSFFDGTVKVYYWQAMRLDKNNHQTTDSGDDETADGTTITHIRYTNAWQYKTADGTWHYFDKDDQLVAYYLQKTEVTQEIDTYMKDWGYTTDGTTPNTSDSKGQVALTVAVVYPDGSVSPAEGNMYAKSTTIFNYKSNRDIGIVAPQNNSDYTIRKITVTDGTRDKNTSANVWYSNDTITWKMKQVSDESKSQWYDETTVWDEVTNAGTTPVVNGKASKIIWSAKNTAKLVLIYLNPIERKTNLHVRYVDDNDNNEILNFQIAMKYTEGDRVPSFLSDLKQASQVNSGTFTLDDDAYVENSSGVNQTFNKDLVTVANQRPEKVDSKYLSGLYEYVSADISEDGKTLTLHYNLDSSKIETRYVIDFGEPITVPLSDIVKNPEDATEVKVPDEATNTYVVNDDNSITFKLDKVLTGSKLIKVIVKYGESSSVTKRIALMPATTVYYEASFVKDGSGATDMTATQEAAKPGETATKGKANYGYDDSYAGTAANDRNIDLKTAGTKEINFRGTGIDIYANTSPSTGTMMIMVKEGNSYKKIVAVDTKMANGANTGNQAVDGKNVPVATLNLGSNVTDYTAELSCVKSGSEGKKDVYLDGFRVYNTTNDKAAVEDYKSDNEANPSYYELRDQVIAAVAKDNNSTVNGGRYADQIAHNTMSQVYASGNVKGAIVIDTGNSTITSAQLKDLVENGPKNELYLQNGQAVTFTLNQAAQIGLKGVNGAASYALTSGKINGEASGTVSTTDMFYRLSSGKVTIQNTGNTILSITKIKAFNVASPASLFAPLTEESLTAALVGLGYEKAPAPTATPTVKPTQKPAQQIKLATPKLGKVVSAGYNALKLNWSKVKNADGYRVFVKVNGQWKALGNVKGTSYVHKNLETGKSYTFTVRAYKNTKSGTVWSAYDTKGITGKPSLSAPSLRKAKRTSAKKATLSWKKVDGANGYVVYRKTNNGRWQIVKKITKGNITSFTDKKLSKGKKYTYTVRAYRTIGKKNVYSGYNKKGLTVK